MSESHDIAKDIVDDRASATTDPVFNERDGSTFTAEIDGSVDPVLIVTELGEDAREAIILHVTDDTQAASIIDGDIVRFTLFGVKTRHLIVKRRDGSATPQTDFWAIRLRGKDT